MTDIIAPFDAAVAAYEDFCSFSNLPFQLPLAEHSKVIKDVVYLRTSPQGYVGRYSIRRHKMLD